MRNRDLPDPGIEPMSPAVPAFQAESLLLSHWGSPKHFLSSSQRKGISQSLSCCHAGGTKFPIDQSPLTKLLLPGPKETQVQDCNSTHYKDNLFA